MKTVWSHPSYRYRVALERVNERFYILRVGHTDCTVMLQYDPFHKVVRCPTCNEMITTTDPWIGFPVNKSLIRDVDDTGRSVSEWISKWLEIDPKYVQVSIDW